MESLRDPLPADVAAEPGPRNPASPVGGASGSQVSSSQVSSSQVSASAGRARLTRGTQAERPRRVHGTLHLGRAAEALAPGDADLIAASRPGRLAAWPPGGPPTGAGYLGWTLVVVTGDPAAHAPYLVGVITAATPLVR
jgi:hypothetical protein